MRSFGPGICDLVPYAPVPAARMREIERELADAAGLIGFHAGESGLRGRLAFFAEFMRCYREGGPVVVSRAVVPADRARRMMAVKELEPELLGGFSRMLQKAVNLCSRVYGRSQDDLQADAYEAFFRCMVNYSGGSRFSTYLWRGLTRNLSRACLDGGELRVPRDVRKITMRVVDAMGSRGETFDEAVGSMGISEECRRKVVAAMSRVSTATELRVEESDMASSTDAESLGWVMGAVERAGLGRLERAVLRGFLDAPSGVMGLTEGCRGMVNPDTGRPYSRYALSEAWRRAREKIARAMEEAA